MEKKIPAGVFLLRKSRGGDKTHVMKPEDFPFRFQFNGKGYKIETTAKGGLIMKAE